MKTNTLKLKTLLSLIFLLVLASLQPLWAGNELSDEEISRAVDRELTIQRGVYASLIDVSTREGIVKLQGTVDNILEKQRSAQVAKTIRGVRGVVNQIEISAPAVSNITLEKDVLDAWLKDPATDSYELEVNANDGQLTLKGKVQSWQEKQLAIKVAKGVRGVTGIEDKITIDPPADVRPDKEVRNEIEQTLKWDSYVDESLIEVKVNNGNVKLSGTVGSEAEKNYAISDAWVDGVTIIDNKKLEVKSWAKNDKKKEVKYEITADEDIENAIENAFHYDPRISDNHPVVESKDGVVTLSGKVNNLRAKRAAAEDARNIIGVIRVKDYIKVRPASELTDDAIERNVRWFIQKDPYVDKYDIDVNVYNGIAYLTGEVDSYFEKRQAENSAEKAKGIISVRNNLDINQYPRNTYFPLFSSYYYYPLNSKTDEEIKSDVESQLWWSTMVNKDQVDVSVEDGTVELTGTVDSWRERFAAEKNAFEGGATSVINHLEVDNHMTYQ